MSILSYFAINSIIKWKLIGMVMSMKTLLETALICRSFFYTVLTLNFELLGHTSNKPNQRNRYIGKMFGQVVLS